MEHSNAATSRTGDPSAASLLPQAPVSGEAARDILADLAGAADEVLKVTGGCVRTALVKNGVGEVVVPMG